MSNIKCPMCSDCPDNCPLDNEEDTREHSADYYKGKSDGAREFAEWLCGKYNRIRQDGIGFEKFQNIHWKSIDEVLAKWQKGEE